MSVQRHSILTSSPEWQNHNSYSVKGMGRTDKRKHYGFRQLGEFLKLQEF